MLLNRSRSSIFVEMTFGNFWEYNIKCVKHSLKVIAYEINSKCKKLSPEK
ncbi:CLUMA_CG005771, isoform A [Clunio marinus]|uniref:CLUMA_CG005771, isoform A n=1 Tax=Clunio marinus TaxID=568069 RepID=A0A1J1HW55_9DIPT|nr:CLUMA_CG005771, isoform A [Clunio marinus]